VNNTVVVDLCSLLETSQVRASRAEHTGSEGLVLGELLANDGRSRREDGSGNGVVAHGEGCVKSPCVEFVWLLISSTILLL
jgi:hypothetical protein